MRRKFYRFTLSSISRLILFLLLLTFEYLFFLRMKIKKIKNRKVTQTEFGSFDFPFASSAYSTPPTPPSYPKTSKFSQFSSPSFSLSSFFYFIRDMIARLIFILPFSNCPFRVFSKQNGRGKKNRLVSVAFVFDCLTFSANCQASLMVGCARGEEKNCILLPLIYPPLAQLVTSR